MLSLHCRNFTSALHAETAHGTPQLGGRELGGTSFINSVTNGLKTNLDTQNISGPETDSEGEHDGLYRNP